MQIDHRLFVKLWDKAVGSDEYDKKDWRDLSNQILEANRELQKLARQQKECRGRGTRD